jgi:hypothetical protein
MEAVMTGGDAFREAMEVAIPPRTEAFAPDVVVISVHFDGHNRDSLGNLNLVEADSVTRSLTEIAQRRYGGLHACSPSSRPCADQLIRRQPAVSLVHRFGGRGFEETRHLLRAQHDRRPARFVHGLQRTNEVGAFERHVCGIIPAGLEIVFAFGRLEETGASLQGGEKAGDGALGQFGKGFC